jgi:hypothetical protein
LRLRESAVEADADEDEDVDEQDIAAEDMVLSEKKNRRMN